MCLTYCLHNENVSCTFTEPTIKFRQKVRTNANVFPRMRVLNLRQVKLARGVFSASSLGATNVTTCHK